MSVQKGVLRKIPVHLTKSLRKIPNYFRRGIAFGGLALLVSLPFSGKAEEPAPKKPVVAAQEANHYTIESGFSFFRLNFFVINNDNLHLFFSTSRTKGYIELVLPIVKKMDGSIDFTKTFASYFNYLKNPNIEVPDFLGNVVWAESIFSLYEAALIQTSIQRNKLYIVVPDANKTKLPPKGTRIDELGRYLHFRVIEQTEAIKEAESY